MRYITVLAIFITLSTTASGRYEPLANEGKRGLDVRYIDHALRLKPEEVDIGNAALLVSEE